MATRGRMRRRIVPDFRSRWFSPFPFVVPIESRKNALEMRTKRFNVAHCPGKYLSCPNVGGYGRHPVDVGFLEILSSFRLLLPAINSLPRIDERVLFTTDVTCWDMYSYACVRRGESIRKYVCQFLRVWIIYENNYQACQFL